VKCRCKKPKKTRIGDDARGLRLMYCETHGFSLHRVPVYAQPRGLYLRMPIEEENEAKSSVPAMQGREQK
jgi:hypothetical protein